MNTPRRRPLALDHLRSFAAVARRLSFSQAAIDLHLTQPAISRQIKAIEEELGAAVFARGTRKVELTADGQVLLQAVAPWLERLDRAVQQIRASRGRRVVNVTTFPSFASLWLLPRLDEFERLHPDIDIRISATESLVDLDGSDFDLALRYCHPDALPPPHRRLFGEVLTPAISIALQAAITAGQAPPLAQPADLAQHTLLEEDDLRPSGRYLSWRNWLDAQGLPTLEPRRWLFLNFTHQQVQAALSGQGVALARLAMVWTSLHRGELFEPFDASHRTASPFAYFMVHTSDQPRAEVDALAAWVGAQAALTRAAIGEAA
jgi:LysR family transcriptional regulator, glycine cleavage system transcriptional activator